jgi:hypothetical protein
MRFASPAFSLVFCSRGCHSFHSSLSLSGASRSVSFHGSASLRRSPRNTRTTATAKLSPSGTHTHAVAEKPPDPRSYRDALEDNVDEVSGNESRSGRIIFQYAVCDMQYLPNQMLYNIVIKIHFFFLIPHFKFIQ